MKLLVLVTLLLLQCEPIFGNGSFRGGVGLENDPGCRGRFSAPCGDRKTVDISSTPSMTPTTMATTSPTTTPSTETSTVSPTSRTVLPSPQDFDDSREEYRQFLLSAIRVVFVATISIGLLCVCTSWLCKTCCSSKEEEGTSPYPAEIECKPDAWIPQVSAPPQMLPVILEDESLETPPPYNPSYIVHV
ncbi:expressed unknown protein [Seminavis robusta]|uniref:Uncharacterized protein n=1 Tax=Seminavis robusta TaxID=568900 RepID=A0A9N8HFC4_9STRA|nr:expressed unknown protein [Seminavis robusta]|eukprot:Sro562_g167040.1 n/a (189) ;mRNA; r:32838-33404